MTVDGFFAEAKRLNLRVLGTPEETRAALDLRDAEIERLRAALTLAANRMDVLALDHDYGTTRRNIADDWAKETRAALGPNVRAKAPT
jgi:hypothetical protein